MPTPQALHPNLMRSLAALSKDRPVIVAPSVAESVDAWLAETRAK